MKEVENGKAGLQRDTIGNNRKGAMAGSHSPLILNGWGTRIRTLINGVRVRRPTIERFPSSDRL